MRLYFEPEAEQLAQCWADRFDLHPAEVFVQDGRDFAIWAVEDHLELRRSGDRRGVWMRPDDLRRRVKGGPELARACGLTGPSGTSARPRVLDAMAGWGLDGLLLARLGCSVVMVEQNPVIHALLEDFLRRLDLPEVHAHCGDGYAWLDGSQTFDVVYLDPMFPLRRKRALPGKRMQYLATLAIADPRSMDSWLQAGLGSTAGRVVVKRRLHDPVAVEPDWQITGRTVRYDVYRGRASDPAPS